MEFFLDTQDRKRDVEDFINMTVVPKTGQFYAAEVPVTCRLNLSVPNPEMKILSPITEVFESVTRYIFFTELADERYTVFFCTPLN